MGYLKEISIRSGERTEFIKPDAQVKKAIEESGVKDGLCYIYVPHTTAGVTIRLLQLACTWDHANRSSSAVTVWLERPGASLR